MSTFPWSADNGKPTQIAMYNINFLLSQPEVVGKTVAPARKYIRTSTTHREIEYKLGGVQEGLLNVYVCRFETGLCRVHIFGKIKGVEFKKEMALSEYSEAGFEFVCDRINYVLSKSRVILKSYYLQANTKSIEDHLATFMYVL